MYICTLCQKLMWSYIEGEPSRVDETCSKHKFPHQMCTMYCNLLKNFCLETNLIFVMSERIIIYFIIIIYFFFLQNLFQAFICPFLSLSLSHQFSSNILLGLNMIAWAWSLDLFSNPTYSQTERRLFSFLLCCTECQLFVCSFLYFHCAIILFVVCFPYSFFPKLYISFMTFFTDTSHHTMS